MGSTCVRVDQRGGDLSRVCRMPRTRIRALWPGQTQTQSFLRYLLLMDQTKEGQVLRGAYASMLEICFSIAFLTVFAPASHCLVNAVSLGFLSSERPG
jgi:hypothetical protein